MSAPTLEVADGGLAETDGLTRPLDDRCSFSAEQRGDDQTGTAPPVARFLLIEQPGPWGRIAVEQSRLDRGVGTALAAACGAASTRPLLIRRPGRVEAPERKRWFLATTDPDGPTMRTGTVGDDRELLDVVTAEDPGEACAGPLYAVCTHGKHDACCAIKGRPVARKLALDLDADTDTDTAGGALPVAWEVSHLGGDRFAGNLVVVPHGLYYGRVDRENVERITAATERGEVVPELLRGCSAFAPAAQAAQAFARVVTGDNRIAAHRPRTLERLEGQRHRVTLDGDAGSRWELIVERRPTGAPELLTCAAKVRVIPPTWALLDLQR